MNAIAKNPLTTLVLEIAGIACLVLAAVCFDASLSQNDFSVAFLFAGLVLFGTAGIFFDEDSHPACEAIPFALGVVGFFVLVLGALFGEGFVWVRPACLFGVFAVVSALSFFKIKSVGLAEKTTF